jgi:hypothetical protein
METAEENDDGRAAQRSENRQPARAIQGDSMIATALRLAREGRVKVLGARTVVKFAQQLDKDEPASPVSGFSAIPSRGWPGGSS